MPGDLPVALSRIRTPPPTQNRSELCSIYAVSASARAQFTTYSMFIFFYTVFCWLVFSWCHPTKKNDKYLIERASPKKWRGLPGRWCVCVCNGFWFNSLFLGDFCFQFWESVYRLNLLYTNGLKKSKICRSISRFHNMIHLSCKKTTLRIMMIKNKTMVLVTFLTFLLSLHS